MWNHYKIPHFNTFHQHGTNKSGDVCVAIGKHLKASRIDFNVENTVIVDVYDLSETTRIMAIYWPICQTRNLEDLEPYIIENTIITGDFNASIQEWDSNSSDKRGRNLKEWVEKIISVTFHQRHHSSKRSKRNIDLTFTNIEETRGETLRMGTSDHWPVMITCVKVGFDSNTMFSYVNWKLYEVILTLLQKFWMDEHRRSRDIDEWYVNYVRFLDALKNRLTKWKDKEKFLPALPPFLIQKLEETKRVRNKYYRGGKVCNAKEETRALLRILTRETKTEIARYKASRWQEFLAKVQVTHDNTDRAFWSYLSRVYKPKSLPFRKLRTNKTILTKDNEISDELYRFYSDHFKEQSADTSNPHEVQIETEYVELMNRVAIIDEEIEKTNVTEIRRHISKVKPKKSTGYDEVSNFIIKKISPNYISCLVNRFNTWLSEYRYPQC